MTLARQVILKSDLSEKLEIRCMALTRDVEENLLKSLRNREDSGFETLVRSYGPQVMAIARRYLRSEADAASRVE